MRIKEFYKKLSVPMRFGLGFLFVDLLFWTWFVVYGLTQARPGIFEEGLLGMMIFHMPASILLPILGGSILSSFFTNNSVIPQTIFLFIVGTAQYFFVGYFIGKLFLFFKKRFSKNENLNPVQSLRFGIKTKKTLMVILGLIYLLFSLGVLTVLIEYMHIKDFGRFRMMRSSQGVFVDLMIFVFWFFISVVIYRYYRKNIKKDKSFIIYLFIPIVISVIVWFFC